MRVNSPRRCNKQFWRVWTGSVVLAALSLVGCTSRTGATADLSAARQSLEEVWTYVNNDFVDGTFNGQDWGTVRAQYLNKPARTPEEVYKLASQMLATLGDPYTRFLNPDQFKSLQTTTTGELSGVGLQITKDQQTDLPIVIAAVEGTPAFRGGIQPRDLIVAIDGKPTRAKALDEVADQLRGEAGTPVTLTVRRKGRSFEVALKRATIAINPVTSRLKQEGGRRIGFVRLSQFNANAVSQVRQAIVNLDRQSVAGFVLDLRSNPGGLLQGGIDISRFFLNSGDVVVYTVNRQGERDEARAVSAPLTTKPVVLLVDGGTASASEILAGALKDNRRALLVGEKTFGKGLIQAIHSLKDGSGVAVSIARYQTPNHIDIHKKGILPDIRAVRPENFQLDQLATAADPQYTAAIKALNAAIPARGG